MAGIGPSLKEAREARHISLEEIASATKIVPRYLEALESDRFDLMPGGFFVKGIIRTYAKAVGLDPDEVLGRYRAAGLLGEPEPKKRFVLKPPAPAPAQPEDTSARPAGPAAAEKPEPDLSIEDAPRPRLSEAARRRLLGLAWRTLAALLLVAVLAVLWSNRRPRPPEEKPATAAPAETAAATTQAPVPAQQVPDGTAGPVSPAAAPVDAKVTPAPAAAEPVPAPAPAVEEAARGIEIEISFQAETWINVLADGVLKVEGVFPPGATARTRAEAKLLIHTGNAGGFTFLLNGRPAKPLGRSGQVLTDVKITPDNMAEFLEVREPAVPEG
ncbi:MAG: helix-turn-helix domain-containing protein [Candidatus Aminicenantes bacterium]|nr:helix-turn-helix domain-containing protein [Candidatus Aminicenantes bacterium]NLH77619.1 helix-turn-helix domain-containing protein [Acidobacteriota bacterium]